MMAYLLLLAMVFVPIFKATSRAASYREIDKKLKGHKKDLESLQEQIRNLETEKVRLKRDEDSLRKVLKKIDSDIERSTKRQVRQKRKIRETEQQIKKISNEISFYSS